MISRHRFAILALTLAAPALMSPSLAAPRGDTDNDGKLSLAEFGTIRKAQIMRRTDTDKDGKLSLAEWTARAQAAVAGKSGKSDKAGKDVGTAGANPRAQNRIQRQFQRLDTNNDGFIDSAELDVLLKRRFDRIDEDHDGFITVTELAARRHASKAN